MPVTPAHLVVAAPAWHQRRWWAAALAAGSVAPDLSHFLPIDPGSNGAEHLRDTAHTLLGAVTIDVVAGIVLLVVAGSVVWPAVLELGPDALVSRVAPAPPRPRTKRLIGGTLLAVLVGCVVHVVLDGLTHQTLGHWPMPVFGHVDGGQILQGGLSVGGLLWLAWEVLQFVDRPRHRVVRPVSATERAAVLVGLAAVAVVSGCERLTEFSSGLTGVRLYGTLVFQGTVRATGVVGIAVVVGSAIWVGTQAWSGRRARRHGASRSGHPHARR